MFLKEPKAEFVPIDLKTLVTASSTCIEYVSQCPDWVTKETAGGTQRCFASQPEAQECVDFDTSIPW